MRGIDIDAERDLLMLLYADDLVILAHSEIDLRNKLKILEEYCLVVGMTVNKDKTKIVVFRAGGRLPGLKDFCYRGEKIEILNSYTYLGVPFSTSALGLIPSQKAIAKTKIATGAVISTLAGLKTDSWESINTIFNSMINPVTLYLAHIWGLRYYDLLEVTQSNFYKRLLHLPQGTANVSLRLELDLYKVVYKMLKQAINWLIKILKMDDSRLQKICLLRQFALLNFHSAEVALKYNWLFQLKKLLGEFNEERHMTFLNAEYWIENKSHILDSCRVWLRKRDLDDYN